MKGMRKITRGAIEVHIKSAHLWRTHRYGNLGSFRNLLIGNAQIGVGFIFHALTRLSFLITS